MGVIEYVPLTTQIGPPWHMLPGFLSPMPGVDLKSEYRWVNGKVRERRTFSCESGSVFTDIGGSKVIMSALTGAESKGVSGFQNVRLDGTKLHNLGWHSIIGLREALELTVSQLRQAEH